MDETVQERKGWTRMTLEEKQHILWLWMNGRSKARISRITKRSTNTIKTLIKQHELKTISRKRTKSQTAK